MVVDDDPGVRNALLEFLALEGFEVQGAIHGMDALEQLQGGYLPDAILLDLSMPVMDGRELHRALQRNPSWSSIPIVVVAALPETAPIGVDAIIPKPFEIDHLLQVISNLTRMPREGCTVLVVEDDGDIREAVVDILRDNGFQAHGAEHGQDALNLLENGLRPEAIVTDLMMPVMTGWELLSRVVTTPTLAEIPVIVMSAATAKLPTGRPLAGVVPKPINMDSLLLLVRRACGRRQLLP